MLTINKVKYQRRKEQNLKPEEPHYEMKKYQIFILKSLFKERERKRGKNIKQENNEKNV